MCRSRLIEIETAQFPKRRFASPKWSRQVSSKSSPRRLTFMRNRNRTRVPRPNHENPSFPAIPAGDRDRCWETTSPSQNNSSLLHTPAPEIDPHATKRFSSFGSAANLIQGRQRRATGIRVRVVAPSPIVQHHAARITDSQPSGSVCGSELDVSSRHRRCDNFRIQDRQSRFVWMEIARIASRRPIRKTPAKLNHSLPARAGMVENSRGNRFRPRSQEGRRSAVARDRNRTFRARSPN